MGVKNLTIIIKRTIYLIVTVRALLLHQIQFLYNLPFK